jgi:antitoxin CcdA
MTHDRPSPKTRKRTVNLSISPDIIQSARDMNLNLSEHAAAGIRAAVRKAMEEQWLRENDAALRAYDARIERDGLSVKGYWLEDLEQRGEI